MQIFAATVRLNFAIDILVYRGTRIIRYIYCMHREQCGAIKRNIERRR